MPDVTKTNELANIDFFGEKEKLFSLEVTVMQDEKINKTVSGKHEDKIDINEIARCLECPVCLTVCKPPVQVNAYNICYFTSAMIIVTVLFP